jgi:hypothetical protein
MSDDERQRKSWREIDKAKDRSTHRREEQPPSEGRRGGARSQRSYRATLDRLFESGKIAKLVEQKAPGVEKTEEEGENRIKLLAKIRSAAGREEVSREVDHFLQHYPLPDDLEILGKVLEHRDPELQRRAIEEILLLLDKEKPKRSRAMIGQLKLIRDTGEDKELESLAVRLLERLE